MNDLSKFLGIQHPIIQAPMAGVSTPQLAAAVSNAGGMGSLGLGSSTVGQARRMIEDTRALTAKPFQVNVFCHQPAKRDAFRESAWIEFIRPLFEELGAEPPQVLNEIYASFLADEAMFDLLLEQRPAVVSFHFGIPSGNRVGALRKAGITLMATATNTDEARQIEAAGIDAIVAQGIEAGGHRGMFDLEAADERLPTATLVSLLLCATKLPIVAAGGIMDGRAIKAMLDLGASAAQLGTAFILCPESAANAGYRAKLSGDAACHTRLTASLSGRPARGMVNRFIVYSDAKNSPPPAAYPMAYDMAKQLHSIASAKDIHDFAAYWAGQGAPLARAHPASDMVKLLLNEMGC